LIDIGIKPKASLLEVGCGSGHLSGYLASKGFTTTLMDFSNVAITKAKAYYEKHGLKGNFVLCDMMELSIEKVTPHDVVWNSGVFEHFDSWQVIDVLRRMGEVAQKYVIVLVPNARSFPYLLFRRHAMENNEWIWGRELLRESIQHLAEAAGLEVIEEKYLGHHYCQAHLDYVKSELGQEYADVYQQNLIPNNQDYLIALVARPQTNQEIVGYKELIEKILKEEAIVAQKTYYFDLSAISNSLKSLQAINLGHQKAKEELSSALQAKDAEIERLLQEVESLQAINLGHQKAGEELSSAFQAKDTEIERLLQEVESLQAINLGHQKAGEELSSAFQAKDAEIERLLQEVESLQAINLGHQKAEGELSSALQAKDAEIERLVKEVESLQAININHQKAEAKLSSAFQAKNAHISELDAEIERLVKEVESLQAININHQKAEAELSSAFQAKDTYIREIEDSIVWQLLMNYQKFTDALLPRGTNRRGYYDAWLLLMRRWFNSKKKSFKKNKVTINPDAYDRTKAVDIICFPIINWDFRYQRPQQLLSRFAKDGYRVFYLTVDLMPLNRKYSVREIQKNIWELMPSISTKFNAYRDTLDKGQIDSFISSIDQVKKDFDIAKALCFVVFPKWEPIVSKLRDIYGWKIIYDCLDEHTGFSNVDNSIVHGEGMLIKRSDLVIATSSHLYNKVNEYRNDALLIPNAGDFEHFSELPQNELLKKIKKPIIGYYGAIAEWFDNDLLEFLATKRKNWDFVLIGHTFGSNIRKLQEFHNVHFLGEKEYSELPKYLYWFDVCIIPFKITPLIEATHPVKFYEYLSSGKPVVSVKLPELLQYHDLCYLADDNEDFLKKIEMALEEEGLETEKRIEFARSNTWNDRYATLATHAEAIFEEADN
jgi:SAM-dependent methyltransferase